MIPAMTSSDDALRQFASRPWHEIARLKARYWATDEMTPTERLRVADAMRQYTLAVRPDWPDARALEADLETHIRLAHELMVTAHGQRR
jgi:hypothetical protein